MQLVYDNFPEQAREGFKVDSSRVVDVLSRIAKETATPFIPYGKLCVQPLGDPIDTVKLPSLGAEITTLGLVTGVALGERIKELTQSATFGHFLEDEAVGCLRKGRIWVIAEDTITDVNLGVFVRFQNPGGSPPINSLGSFAGANSADHDVLANARWRSTTAAPAELAILEVDF